MYDINLYPPVFTQSYMPAFIYNVPETCKIYFQLSSLNTLDDLCHTTVGNITTYRAVQVTIRDQKTNQSMFIDNDIHLYNLNIDNNGQYYIQLSSERPSDLRDGGFKLNQYYKVQIRFTDKDIQYSQIPPRTTNLSQYGQWLADNIDHFSQWSSVVLIRGISQPNLTYTINGSGNSEVYVTTDYVHIDGQLTFADSADTERLEKYRIVIYDSNWATLVEDSGDVYVEKNTFSYIIKKVLGVGQRYYVYIKYTTNNLYETPYIGPRAINITQITPMPLNMLLQQQVNNSGGYIKLVLTRNAAYTEDSSVYNLYSFEETPQVIGDNTDLILVSHETVSARMTNKRQNDKMQYDHARFDPYYHRALYLDEYNKSFLEPETQVVIRRTSSRDNFTSWEKLADFIIEDQDIVNFYWYDYSAEPGVWYRYQVVTSNSMISGTTGTLMTPQDAPVMLDTEDIFLNAWGKELIVKFDPDISNLTNKTAESVTDTIGSKYPFIRRNGNVDYKTFSLSGTISYFMDIGENVFKASKEEVFGDSAHLYSQYNEEKNIDMYRDFIYEKFFREKVLEFLQNSDVKLFKSLTQGNILVKLNNISLTPNQTLGRLIYSFSCTAYEVAECNGDNYMQYNILTNNTKAITKADINGVERTQREGTLPFVPIEDDDDLIIIPVDDDDDDPFSPVDDDDDLFDAVDDN